MQHLKKLTILLLILAGSTMACSSSKAYQSKNSVPGWVNNPGSEYSESRYLMAVGSGSTMADARSRAMQNLAQTFRQQITGSQDLYSKFEETSRNNEGFSSNETMRLINNIRIGANEDLMNTEVLESYVASDGQYYVLAGMDRAASVQVYRQEMTNNTTKIDNHLVNSQAEPSIVRKLGEAKQAVLLAQVNENFTRQLGIIQPGSADAATATQKVVETENYLKDLQKQAVVSVSMVNENTAVKSAVTKVLQEEGFSVGSGSSALLTVTVNYEAQEANLNRDDAKFARWDLSISISESESGQSYKTFTAQGRDGALSLADAYKRAEFTASKEIETKFARFLNTELTAQN